MTISIIRPSIDELGILIRSALLLLCVAERQNVAEDVDAENAHGVQPNVGSVTNKDLRCYLRRNQELLILSIILNLTTCTNV